MDFKITWTSHLKDGQWGFSELLNGRELNEETKEEIKDLIEDNLSDAVYSNSVMAIEIDTSQEQNALLPVVSGSVLPPSSSCIDNPEWCNCRGGCTHHVCRREPELNCSHDGRNK